MFDSLISYLDSIKARDPAPRTRWEVLLYPGVWALAYHRVAHWLFVGELYSQPHHRNYRCATTLVIPPPIFDN